MTHLLKPVARRVVLDPRLGPRERGDVTTTLYPNGTIGFRKLRSHKEVRISLDACYALALKAEARAEARVLKLARAARRKK